jgi:3-hydroxyacyl-[acyl-carrier-protein] dehydratase
MNFEARCVIDSDHPSLPGHFPNAPIVPGVVLLDEVFSVLAEWRKGCRVMFIRAVKFLAPLKPGQPFLVRLSESENRNDEVDFCCRIGEHVIVEGTLQIHGRKQTTS